MPHPNESSLAKKVRIAIAPFYYYLVHDPSIAQNVLAWELKRNGPEWVPDQHFLDNMEVDHLEVSLVWGRQKVTIQPGATPDWEMAVACWPKINVILKSGRRQFLWRRGIKGPAAKVGRSIKALCGKALPFDDSLFTVDKVSSYPFDVGEPTTEELEAGTRLMEKLDRKATSRLRRHGREQSKLADFWRQLRIYCLKNWSDLGPTQSLMVNLYPSGLSFNFYGSEGEYLAGFSFDNDELDGTKSYRTGLGHQRMAEPIEFAKGLCGTKLGKVAAWTSKMLKQRQVRAEKNQRRSISSQTRTWKRPSMHEVVAEMTRKR